MPELRLAPVWSGRTQLHEMELISQRNSQLTRFCNVERQLGNRLADCEYFYCVTVSTRQGVSCMRHVAYCLAFLIASTCAFAQVGGTGSIQGTVTDPAGAT